MKKLLHILTVFLTLFPNAYQAQSVFDDYGTAVTNLGASPYTSLNLDALDYNPAGNVFQRNGFELSLSSLWPRIQTIENSSAFTFKNHDVYRQYMDQSKGNVPNPSIRVSYHQKNNAFSFSYAHGERLMEGNGNACFDDVVQKVMPVSTDLMLSLISTSYASTNQSVYNQANLLSQQYGIDIQAPYSDSASFPISFLSNLTFHGCWSDRFSGGYTVRINTGDNNRWEYISLYGGVKYQKMVFHQKTYLGTFCYDEKGQILPMKDICAKYSDFYNNLSGAIPDMYDSFKSLAQKYDELGQSFDTLLLTRPRSSEVSAWGVSAVLGFNWVRPYWNLSTTLQVGLLPFKFSIGYSRNLGKWQLGIGGDFGFADVNYGTYSSLFNYPVDCSINDCYYGNIGFEVARRFPKLFLTIKVGNAVGINKDVLLNNGYALGLGKYNAYSPSCIIEWQTSSLFSLIGSFRAQFPISDKEQNIGMGGIVESNALCVINPEYLFSIGFIAHLE